jgi:hypothetical protein
MVRKRRGACRRERDKGAAEEGRAPVEMEAGRRCAREGRAGEKHIFSHAIWAPL